jgi:oligopeptide/dipeptide ABC transporter ATP-binding protein
MADRILVMYAGKVMEFGGRADVFATPRHPYTEALLSAAVLDGGQAEEVILEGDPPSTIAPPPGCRFNTRCPFAGAICAVEEPELVAAGEEHEAACHILTGKTERTRRGSSSASMAAALETVARA